ncbi:MAG: hypothetical protein ACOYLO_00020 [Ferruginibacter sp.]
MKNEMMLESCKSRIVNAEQAYELALVDAAKKYSQRCESLMLRELRLHEAYTVSKEPLVASYKAALETKAHAFEVCILEYGIVLECLVSAGYTGYASNLNEAYRKGSISLKEAVKAIIQQA